jgi:hypothetical protein
MIVINTIFENRANECFREKSSFFQIPPVKKAMLRRSPPTSHYRRPYSRVEDYGLNVSITPWFSSGAELTRTHIPENKNQITIF